jgi:hypothetical protein
MEGLNAQEKIAHVEEETRETKIGEAEKFVSEMFESRLSDTLEKIRTNPYFQDLNGRN